jgi:hypothetical protein
LVEEFIALRDLIVRTNPRRRQSAIWQTSWCPGGEEEAFQIEVQSGTPLLNPSYPRICFEKSV